jgi:glycosyltransferase involved in cell wall biosynthesis
MQYSLDCVYVVIPVYNNAATIYDVATQCRLILDHILVIDDGSTDCDIVSLFKNTDIKVLRHEKNQGKGKALMSALDFLKTADADFMITIDADGQHRPEDIRKFLPHLNEETVLVGCRDFTVANIPEKSKFGRNFSNFWFKVETGKNLSDCQSGFRAYPVKLIAQLGLKGKYYDFETEVITRAVWAGLRIKEVAIDVYYAPPGERITHFKPFKDNLRITLMHIRLIARRLFLWPHKCLVKKEISSYRKLFKNPREFFQFLLKENSTPQELAASAFVGVTLGVLPLISMHSIAIIYVTARLNLNKIMALVIQNIANPPFVPVLCIELGHYFLHRNFLTQVSIEIVFKQLHMRLFEWLIGSLIVAPVLSVIVAIIVYFLAKIYAKRS